MSRIGRLPITVPAGVTVEIKSQTVTATGPKGSLEVPLFEGLKASQNEGVLTVDKTIDDAQTQRTYGLQRTLINNIVVGVSQGYQRQLEINGVGYRAAVSGNTVTFNLGYSHPIEFKLPEGIEAKVERNLITVSGADKQAVGQVAANMRALRKPEPYKGKGIKYVEERIRRKAGKTAAK